MAKKFESQNNFSSYKLFLIMTLAIAFVSGIWMHARHYRLERELIERSQEILGVFVRGVVYEQERLIGNTEVVLGSLPENPLISLDNVDVCNETLSRVMEYYPEYYNLGVINRQGLVVCSGLPFEGPVDVSDRVYFQKALQTKQFSVGNYQIGRITNKQSINFGYPVLDENGEVQYVLFAALGLDWLVPYVHKRALPESTMVMVLDHDGKTLVRLPDESGEHAGDFELGTKVVGSLVSNPDGKIEFTGSTGKEWVAVFTSINEESELIVGAAMTRKGILRDHERMWVENWLFLGGMVFVFSIVGVAILKSTKRRRR